MGRRSSASIRSRRTSATSRGAPSRSAASAPWPGVGVVGNRVDGVLAMSPPLTLGLTGWGIAVARRAPHRVQHPGRVPRRRDRARGAQGRARASPPPSGSSGSRYARADAVTVLSDDLRDNVVAKVAAGRGGQGAGDPELRRHRLDHAAATREQLSPRARHRREDGGDVRGQHRHVAVARADARLPPTALAHDPEVESSSSTAAARPGRVSRSPHAACPTCASSISSRGPGLPEVLAAADIHVVPLKRGLGRSSVPIEDVLDPRRRASRARERRPRHRGRAASSSNPARACRCRPTIPRPSPRRLTRLVAAPDEVARMGAAGRRFVEGWASPAAVAEQYEDLFTELRSGRR